MGEDKALEKRRVELKTKYLGEDLAEELTKPTPDEVISERPVRGGGMVKYVAGPHFIRKLNDCFGFLWSYEVPSSFELNGQIVGKGRLTVHIPHVKKRIVKKYLEEGREVEEVTEDFEMLNIVKEQFGSSEVKKYSQDTTDKRGNVTHHKGDVIDLGDDHKGMGTDAMKKCATGFGIFLDVYESRAGEEEGVVTKQQLNVFYMRAEQAGMDKEKAEKWGEEEVGKPMVQWNPLECMELIPKLIDIAEGKEKEELE